jgi:hypothetical protein
MKDIRGMNSARHHHPNQQSCQVNSQKLEDSKSGGAITDNPRSARISIFPGSSHLPSLTLSQDGENPANNPEVNQSPKPVILHHDQLFDGTQDSINNTQHQQEFFEILDHPGNTMTMTMTLK